MINLRYHIVSITAVFLALGIGLFLGSSMLSDVALSSVKNSLERAETRIDDTNERNADLSGQLDEAEERDAQLKEFGLPQIIEDHLQDTPVVVVAADGADQRSLESLQQALADSDATFEGTLILTGKMGLEGDSVEQMAAVLDEDSADPEQLRGVLIDRLASTLVDAAEPAQDPDEGGTGGEAGEPETPEGTTTTAAEDPLTEPELITALRSEGFIDFVPPPGGQDEATVLTAQGYRYVFVSGPNAEVPDADMFLPLVRDMAQEAPAPLVVASAPDQDAVEDTRTAVVGPIRDDEDISDRVATVDDLETAAGIIAVILELDRLDGGVRGHYGVGDGATSVLPLPGS